jgi:GGDEF domain-containing protein
VADVTQAASLAVPALLLSIAAGLAMVGTLPDWLAAAVEVAPFAVFGGAASLAILLRRGRLVLGLVTLLLADLALAHFGDRAIFNAVGLLLPLNLAGIVWISEANIVTAHGALRLGVILAQAGIVATLRHPELAALAQSLEHPLVATNLGAWTALPHLVLVAFIVGLGVILARLVVNGRSLPAGVAWALVASFLALDGAGAGRPATVYFVTAGLLFVIGGFLEPSRLAFLDDTTGLSGRLALNEALRKLRPRYLLARRYALASVEIDEFRRFREEHGPDAARRMLRRVAEALKKVGGGGRAFYCEGGTFALVFRRTSAEAAARHLDAVRRAIEVATIDIRVPERQRPGTRPARAGAVEWTVAVTISGGVAQPETRSADPHDVLRASGRALDRVKQAGLNRVLVASPGT